MYYIARDSHDPGNFFQHAKKAPEPKPQKSFGAPPRGSFAVDGLPPELQNEQFIPPHLVNKDFMQRPSMADLKALEAQGKQVRVKKIYHVQKDNVPKPFEVPVNNFNPHQPPLYQTPMQPQYADPYESPMQEFLQQKQNIQPLQQHPQNQNYFPQHHHFVSNTPPRNFAIKQNVEPTNTGSLPNQFIKSNGHTANCVCHACEPRKNCHCEHCHDQFEHSHGTFSPVHAKPHAAHTAHAPVHRSVSQNNVSDNSKQKSKRDKCNCYECIGATAPFDKGESDGWSVATDKSSKSWYKK